jgi:hypothetical protein
MALISLSSEAINCDSAFIETTLTLSQSIYILLSQWLLNFTNVPLSVQSTWRRKGIWGTGKSKEGHGIAIAISSELFNVSRRDRHRDTLKSSDEMAIAMPCPSFDLPVPQIPFLLNSHIHIFG